MAAINIVGAITSVMSCLCAQNCLHESLGHQIRHLRRPKRNSDKLKSLKEELEARKVDVSTKLNQMWLQKGMNPKRTVELWLKNVDKIASEVNTLIMNTEQESGSPGFQDETTRAAALFEAFKRRSRFALILDDLWEPFSLERVGIPIPTIENGCKLLITTRRLSVCRGMETDQDVKVKVLTENEAWNLFRDKVGEAALASPDIQQIAKLVAKECTVDRISASRQKGNFILNELKYACLLESAAENVKECVKMHDLIRDMAITIMRTDPNWHCIVKAGSGLTKPPHIDEWVEDVQRVSLMKNDLKNIFLGNPPPCPGVTSLLLQYNSFPQNLPYDFFDSMPSLKVLDVSYTGIDSLPGSFSNLVNLCALLVSNCWNLRAIPSLAKLIKLMALDLPCSRNIKELPQGTEQLGNLRRLNISNTMIKTLPSGLLSALTLLEELLASNALVFQIPLPPTSCEISIDEIISSSSLSSLEVDFWYFDLYDLYTRSGHWVQLDKFKFNVGPGELQQVSEKRSVEFLGISIAKGLLIPTNTTELKFIDCHDVTELTTCLMHVEKLKKCTIVCCYSVEYIVEPGRNDLSMLETLVLRFLINLQMICREVVTPSTLMSLKIINVEFCPNLKNLFSGNLLLQLLDLEEIRVSHCNSMEDLMRWEGGSNNIYAAKILLPKLQKLRLESMPKLKEIYSGFISFGSLCSVHVISCDALKRLPFELDDAVGLQQQQLVAPGLEIRGTKYWWESLEWDEPAGCCQTNDGSLFLRAANGVRSSW
ncbi:P-loop containing nucleoside triphosphate hydrolase [Sesbania bispinosa]|nr:P-loop containing nucleoside triphosphate hydrolase [Sesbania bispinosa]